MARDSSCGPTRAADTKRAARRVAAATTRVTVSSRLAFALCLLLAAALGAVGVSACGGSSTESVSPAAIVSGTPVALATSAAAQEFHGMLPYVWTQSLIKERPYRSTKTVGDVVQMRHAVWSYRHASSDSRLTGRFDVVINVDQRQSDKSAALWGTGVLRNAGGTWVQRWTGGIAAGGDVHHNNRTFKGTGGDAGLVAHESGWFAEAGEGFTPDIQIVGAAWIETTDGSPVPAAPGPGTTPANWTPVVGIATTKEIAYDGPGPWVWNLEQSDPRVNGRVEGAIEGIGYARPDGSSDMLSSNTLGNQDGSWDAPSGPIQVRGPAPRFEHFLYWTSTGSGAYAGLTYHGFWFFPEPRSFRPGDKFVWSGWIEEAM
jgi:hypothetical protein